MLLLQAGYYVLTGLWPVLHLPSFEAVTGPKIDDWLVRTVGLLAVAVGSAIGVAAVRRRPWSAEILTLAGGSAAAFAAIDFWYALGGRIPPVYLLDGVVELGFIGGALYAAFSRGDRRP